MTHPIPGPLDLARIAGEMAEAVAEEEARLLREMQGLAKPTPKTEAEKKKAEDETDEGFDNMPV